MTLDILDYPFMRAALLTGLVLGVLFALMGIFVVTKGMAFFSDFIAHSAILGGAIAVMAGAEPSLFLVPYSLAVAFAVSLIWNYFPLSRDTALGVFYGGAVAAGIILIITRGLGQQSLIQFLFGDILLIRPLDIWLSAGLLAAFAAFLKLRLRNLLRASFLPEISAAEGVRVKLYDYALIAFISITIALSIKLVGVVLANSMVVIPAAAAKTVSRSFRQFMLLAPVAGVSAFVLGIVLSFYLNLPSGPAVIASAFCIFLAALAAHAVRGG
ncbi:MAG: metal ABC transporter permease [Thermodesulfovibrionales bacterium]